MPQPNTASPSRSIWSTVDQTTFTGHVERLCKSGRVPSPWTDEESNWPEDTPDSRLPFKVERQLVDDLAFIAANEYRSDCVAAAAIEPPVGSQKSLVRLAANNGVSPVVKNAFSGVFTALRKCALKSELQPSNT